MKNILKIFILLMTLSAMDTYGSHIAIKQKKKSGVSGKIICESCGDEFYARGFTNHRMKCDENFGASVKEAKRKKLADFLKMQVELKMQDEKVPVVAHDESDLTRGIVRVPILKGSMRIMDTPVLPNYDGWKTLYDIAYGIKYPGDSEKYIQQSDDIIEYMYPDRNF